MRSLPIAKPFTNMEQPDNDIITRFNRGEALAFTAVYNEYYPAIYYFVRRFIADREDAEDITADVFVKLWKMHANLESIANIKAFLYVAARNTCIDFLRYTQRQNANRKKLLYLLEQEPSEGPLQDDLWTEMLQYIYKEIDKLPRSCRKVFKMSYLEGRSNSDISKALHINPQSVYNHKQRAIKSLRLALFDKKILAVLLFYCCCTACQVLR